VPPWNCIECLALFADAFRGSKQELSEQVFEGDIEERDEVSVYLLSPVII